MLRRSLVLSSMLVAALAAGCSGSTTAAQGENASATAPQAAAIAPQAKGHVRVVADALATLPLRDDQRAEVEQLAQAAETRRASAAQARGDVALAIAGQIEAGAIDRAALQPKIDAAASAAAANQPADRAAFERVHALLTPDQREHLVDALKGRFKAMHGDHKGRLQEWKTDLALTDDQVDQIKAILKAGRAAHKDEHKEHFGHGKAMMEAFTGDHFVMDEVAPAPDAHERANAMSGHMLDSIEKILPILTPQQRTVAAAKIRSHVQASQTTGAEDLLPPL